MEQNEYSKLPVNLRKQIFELYTGARNPNYSPDFNSGFIHMHWKPYSDIIIVL